MAAFFASLLFVVSLASAARSVQPIFNGGGQYYAPPPGPGPGQHPPPPPHGTPPPCPEASKYPYHTYHTTTSPSYRLTYQYDGFQNPLGGAGPFPAPFGCCGGCNRAGHVRNGHDGHGAAGTEDEAFDGPLPPQ